MMSSIRKSKTAKKLMCLMPSLIVASGIYFSEIKSAHASDANVETNISETNVGDKTEQKNKLIKIFGERRDFEFELELWKKDIPLIPFYRIYDPIDDYAQLEGKPDTLTQESIDKIGDAAEYANLNALGKVIGEIHLYQKIKQVVKGVSSVEVEKIKGEKAEVKPPSPGRKVNPIDKEIEEIENDIKKLKAAGFLSQVEQKEKKIRELKLKRKLDFNLKFGVGLTNPPKKFDDILKIGKFGYEVYGGGEYKDLDLRLSVYPLENKTNLKAEEKFLEDKLKVSGEHSYTWENGQQISTVRGGLKVKSTLNFEMSTSFYWDSDNTKYSFTGIKELGRRNQLSLTASYDEEGSDFSCLLKFKWLQF